MNATVVCLSCGNLPRIRRGHHHRRDTWTAECRNDINCPAWPITSDHPTREAAVRAWDRGDAFKDLDHEPASDPSDLPPSQRPSRSAHAACRGH